MTYRSTTRAFLDGNTRTLTYVVWDHATRRAAIIDPVLDFDLESGRIETTSADRVLAYLADHRLEVEWILETHAHADHLSSAQYLRACAGGRVAIGADIRIVQATFMKIYGLEPQFMADEAPFDHLFHDGEAFRIGGLAATALHVPGHTPADMAYLVDGAVFVGDTLFMPDVGSARTDFPGGDARQLYQSIRRLLELPPDMVMYVCHDYPPAHRGSEWQTTVAEQRAANVHAHVGVSQDAFATMRIARDATLDTPRLFLPSIQINVLVGFLPHAGYDGVRYLRIPLAMPSWMRSGSMSAQMP